MDHNFNSDPLSQLGYWSPQTSAANFCEVDYNITLYIAEFINTFSNLAFIYQALVTLPPHIRGGQRFSSLWQWPVEAWALILVGVGSGAFHMTLRHYPQILDESGMYLIVGALDYRLWSHGRSEVGRWLLGIGLTVAIAGVILWNMLGPQGGMADNKVHLTLFIGLLTALWPRVLWMIRKQRTQRKAAGKGKENGQTDVTSRTLMRQYQLGVFYFFAGFGLWLIDGRFCYGLRDTRSILGLPLGWLLEFHGWWHLLTAMGAGRFVWVARELTRQG
jgi:dihydroceramidase